MVIRKEKDQERIRESDDEALKNVLPQRDFYLESNKTSIVNNFKDKETQALFQKIIDDVYEIILARLNGFEPNASSIVLGLIVKHSVQFFMNQVDNFNREGEYDEGLVNYYTAYINMIEQILPTIRQQGMEAAKFIMKASRGNYLARDDVGIGDRVIKKGQVFCRDPTTGEMKLIGDNAIIDFSKAEYGMVSPERFNEIMTSTDSEQAPVIKCNFCGTRFETVTELHFHERRCQH